MIILNEFEHLKSKGKNDKKIKKNGKKESIFRKKSDLA